LMQTRTIEPTDTPSMASRRSGPGSRHAARLGTKGTKCGVILARPHRRPNGCLTRYVGGPLVEADGGSRRGRKNQAGGRGWAPGRSVCAYGRIGDPRHRRHCRLALADPSPKAREPRVHRRAAARRWIVGSDQTESGSGATLASVVGRDAPVAGARASIATASNELSRDPKRVDKAKRQHYAALYAQPGAIASGFAQS